MAPVIFGFNLAEMKWSAFSSREMFNRRWHLRRERFGRSTQFLLPSINLPAHYLLATSCSHLPDCHARMSCSRVHSDLLPFQVRKATDPCRAGFRKYRSPPQQRSHCRRSPHHCILCLRRHPLWRRFLLPPLLPPSTIPQMVQYHKEGPRDLYHRRRPCRCRHVQCMSLSLSEATCGFSVFPQGATPSLHRHRVLKLISLLRKLTPYYVCLIAI